MRTMVSATLRNLLAVRGFVACVTFFVAFWFLIVPGDENLTLIQWVAMGHGGFWAAAWLAVLQGIVTVGLIKLMLYVSPGANMRVFIAVLASFAVYLAMLAMGGYLAEMSWEAIAWILAAGLSLALASPYLAAPDRVRTPAPR